MWVGPDQSKKWLYFGKYLDHILDIKKSWIFGNAPIQKSPIYKSFLKLLMH